jgi:CPA2 family monovalent cation:H+ antiporter-2
MADLAKAGGLLPVLQPFAALYVLILAVLGPLLTKESEHIYELYTKAFRRRGPEAGEKAKEIEKPREIEKPMELEKVREIGAE